MTLKPIQTEEELVSALRIALPFELAEAIKQEAFLSICMQRDCDQAKVKNSDSDWEDIAGLKPYLTGIKYSNQSHGYCPDCKHDMISKIKAKRNY